MTDRLAQRLLADGATLPTGLRLTVDAGSSEHTERAQAALSRVPEGQQIIFKLTLPSVDNAYRDFTQHPKVLKVVALSGGIGGAKLALGLSRVLAADELRRVCSVFSYVRCWARVPQL